MVILFVFKFTRYVSHVCQRRVLESIEGQLGVLDSIEGQLGVLESEQCQLGIQLISLNRNPVNRNFRKWSRFLI